MKTRCPWVPLGKPLYIAYHDEEWGVPAHDDRTQFEFLVLESAQAGLSWETILNKREGYRAAFADFNPAKVAQFGSAEVERLMGDASIVRNRAKIETAIQNAQQFLAVQKEHGTFSDYIWQFVGGAPIINARKTLSDYPTATPESTALATDLKKRGFAFVGPTIMYAHMQAVGMVNDHTIDCFRYKEAQEMVK